MKHNTVNRQFGVLFAGLLTLALSFSTAAASQTGSAPLPSELQNGSFSGFAVTDIPVMLKDGKWQGEPYDKGAASRPEILLLAGTYLAGDFDGNGSDDAAVLLTESGGGTGTFYYLAVVVKKDGKQHNIATTMLGDRVQIIETRSENGVISVTMLQAGPDDAACCPADIVTRTFILKGNTLQEEKRTGKADRLTPEVMAGVTWVLTGWKADEPAPRDPEITLEYKDGKFSGSSGCNRYFTDVTVGDVPGYITVGMIGATRMMCPPPMNEAEM
ncbi:MAG: META domain-containing protein, partial [Thermodesulfobacteriota bacterium]|nr:META domain-containing protein [Thermodesulfobacteriota bacterium]